MIVEKSKLLMIQPKNLLFWGLPGGGVENDEGIIRGIQRECMEEIGYHTQPESDQPFFLIESYWYSDVSQTFFHSVDIMYLFHLTHHKRATPRLQEGEDIGGMQWIPLLKISKKMCHPVIYPAIVQLKKKFKK